jgi:predicted metal-dependent peptidase
MPSPRRGVERTPQHQLDFHAGIALLDRHPLFYGLLSRSYVNRRKDDATCPRTEWAVVNQEGHIDCSYSRRGTPDDWAYVVAHCLLHLAFGHHVEQKHPVAWNLACDLQVADFLAGVGVGTAPAEYRLSMEAPARGEEAIYELLVARGGAPHDASRDLVWNPKLREREVDWQKLFARGVRDSVTHAVRIAGGLQDPEDPYAEPRNSPATRARDWFITHYPLLGGMAARFRIVENLELCRRLEIQIAAVDAEEQTIYINPATALDDEEMRFVMAHEFLHPALLHHKRVEWRDAFLWNIATDFVINHWLVEMGVGQMPSVGVLYDPELAGRSAEEIYDLIRTDLRRYRKLATLRGIDKGDMLGPSRPDWWLDAEGSRLDDFYRRALSEGLVFWDEQGMRGYLPAGLVEEIRALEMPPIAWDVELARWFEERFAPVETRRTYGRPSRRQSASPDIPRPRVVPAMGPLDGRTFGVVLDTSGSMDRAILARALGTIASYASAHDVPAARVVFCDAAAYDAGYLAPDVIADRVRVKGRGGTILMPGVKLLEKAEDFPDDGPILVITDAWCDRVRSSRNHAFVIPYGAQLPFVPGGPVFRVKLPKDGEPAGHSSNQRPSRRRERKAERRL